MAFDLSTAKPVSSGFDLSTAKPVGDGGVPLDVPTTENLEANKKAAQKYAKDTEGVTLPFGNKLVGDVEGVAAAVTGSLGGLVGMFSPQAGQAVTYEPRTKTGRENIDLINKIVEKTKIAGLGPAESGMLAGRTGGLRPSVPIPGVKGRAPVVETPRAPGVGAEAAVNELQRQRDVLDTGKPTPYSGTQSKAESALAKAQGAVGKFQEVLKGTKGEFPVKGALDEIDRQLGGTAIEVGERQALQRVKDAINLAIKNSGGGQELVQTSAGPMVVKNGKLVPAETKSGLSLDYLDNVRQIIGKEISAKDTGGKPLSADAQRRLYTVQEELLKGAPEPYRAAIKGINEARTELEGLQAPGSAASKVTADPAAFNLMNATDKQNLLQKAFTSDTPGRALSELVRDTQHSPEALNGVRVAYADWLTQPDPLTGKPTAKGLTSRWQDTKEAARTSKLMTEEHIASMDKVMNDIRENASSVVKKAWASTGGFLLGQSVGHPIVGAHLVRDLVMKAGKENIGKSLEQAVMQIGANPEGAAALAAPPTAENVAKVRAMLPTDIAAMLVAPEAQLEQGRENRRPRAKRLLSLQPSGL